MKKNNEHNEYYYAIRTLRPIEKIYIAIIIVSGGCMLLRFLF
jgi:hypothetical protein